MKRTMSFAGGGDITLTSTSFAKYVFVDIAGYTGKLSDNYFDLDPGMEKRIVVDKNNLPAGRKLIVRVKSLYDVVGK